MARNVEIKARITDIESIITDIAKLADKGPIELSLTLQKLRRRKPLSLAKKRTN